MVVADEPEPGHQFWRRTLKMVQRNPSAKALLLAGALSWVFEGILMRLLGGKFTYGDQCAYGKDRETGVEANRVAVEQRAGPGRGGPAVSLPSPARRGAWLLCPRKRQSTRRSYAWQSAAPSRGAWFFLAFQQGKLRERARWREKVEDGPQQPEIGADPQIVPLPAASRPKAKGSNILKRGPEFASYKEAPGPASNPRRR